MAHFLSSPMGSLIEGNLSDHLSGDVQEPQSTVAR